MYVNHKDESSVMHLLARLGNFHTSTKADETNNHVHIVALMMAQSF